MTSEQAGDADSVRAVLRSELTSAIKARDGDAVAALRCAIAVIDNAESVDPAGARTPPGSGSIAGSADGVGATEVARRTLSAADVCALLHDQVRDYLTEAQGYESLGKPDAATQLRRRADVVRRHLDR
ncbi:MAG: hypothetical protein U1D00_27185 [Mycobacterium sp.]|nr:hypothetical protein [Mycobacterium sp.]